MNAHGNPKAQASSIEATEEHFPRLKTTRLALRELDLADAPTLLSIHGDRNAMQWFGTDSMTSLEQAKDQAR